MARQFLLPAVLATAAAAATAIVPRPCDCWGVGSSVFTHHRRWDFATLPKYVSEPDIPSTADAASSAEPASDYFLSDEFSSFWEVQTWPREETDSSILMVNSPANVYIAADTESAGPSSTYLVLRTARHANGLQTAAEFQSVQSDLQFFSARMYARTVGAAGACTAMLTYLDGDPVQEADVEFLTKGNRSTAHYANQPSDVDGATRSVAMPVAMGDWAEHRLDWTDGSTEWFVNARSVAQISFQAPADPTQLVFNSWSNGGPWTGLMGKGQEARLEIRWIEIAYNVSGVAGVNSSCSNVCNVH